MNCDVLRPQFHIICIHDLLFLCVDLMKAFYTETHI